MIDMSFYKGKKVLITGHTGFKGSWMCETLINLGAVVTGFALEPPTEPALFRLSGLADKMDSVVGDIGDIEQLKKVFERVQPEIVFHLAAQPIVRESYRNPVYTYETNVMGTVNVLECVRLTDSVKSFVNVTTDKVYKNKEWEWGYRENEELNGFDPYSNSKSCSELVTSSYCNSFFSNNDRKIAISTARAGNVIGGGDFAADRIIPDCVRAAIAGEDIIVRNPYSIRPYQHVLEPVFAYLMIAMKQYDDDSFAGQYNVGPDESDCVITGRLVGMFCDSWKNQTGKEISWRVQGDNGPHEANFLKLDCSKIKKIFGWRPVWNIEEAVSRVNEWNNAYITGKNVSECMDDQIYEYQNSMTDIK